MAEKILPDPKVLQFLGKKKSRLFSLKMVLLNTTKSGWENHGGCPLSPEGGKCDRTEAGV